MDVVATLRAAGCVWAEEEAEILRQCALTTARARGSSSAARELALLVQRRVAGEPLEYVVGWAGFLGLRLRVAPGVFVPRRRSELLARLAIERARDGSVVVELCAGVAPVAAAVSVAQPTAVVHAVDRDPTAVDCARRNLPNGMVHRGDLFDALPRTLRHRVDVVAASPPYVPTAELHLMPGEARAHEPAYTLDGGADGLDVARRIVADAPRWLAPAGRVLLECARNQAERLEQVFAHGGFTAEVATDDERESTVVHGALL